MIEIRDFDDDEDMDNEAETVAVNACSAAMRAAAENSPLTNSLIVYAAIDLAMDLCGIDYADEVFREIKVMRELGLTSLVNKH